jgi:hypothetical protein
MTWESGRGVSEFQSFRVSVRGGRGVSEAGVSDRGGRGVSEFRRPEFRIEREEEFQSFGGRSFG